MQMVLKPCSHDPGRHLYLQLTFLRKTFVTTSWNKIIILHRDVKCVLLIIFLVQNLISSDNPVSIWLRWIWISPFWLGVKDRYCNTRFFLQEKFLQENEPQKPRNLKKMLRKLKPQMPKLKFLKTLIFPSTLQRFQNWVNFSFFSSLKFFCFSIIKKMTFMVSVKPN